MKVSNEFLIKKNEPKQKIKTKIIKKNIEVYDKDDKLIDTCKNIAEITKKYNVNEDTVRKHVRGRTKYSMLDYSFRYAK